MRSDLFWATSQGGGTAVRLCATAVVAPRVLALRTSKTFRISRGPHSQSSSAFVRNSALVHSCVPRGVAMPQPRPPRKTQIGMFVPPLYIL